MRAAQLTGWRAPLEPVDLPEADCPADGVMPRWLACGRCPDSAAGCPTAGFPTICADRAMPGLTQAGAGAEMIAVPHADAKRAVRRAGRRRGRDYQRQPLKGLPR